jgi:hypothetical protein
MPPQQYREAILALPNGSNLSATQLRKIADQRSSLAIAIATIRLENESQAGNLFWALVDSGSYCLPVDAGWGRGVFGLRTSLTAAHETDQIDWALLRLCDAAIVRAQ